MPPHTLYALMFNRAHAFKLQDEVNRDVWTVFTQESVAGSEEMAAVFP